MTKAPEQIYATCISIDGKGVLIRGASGSGKSDLALRLIDDGAELVSDDRVDLAIDNGALLAAPPETIAGLFEVRGVGILRMVYRQKVPVHLVIDLQEKNSTERLPEPETVSLFGHPVPCLKLFAFEASAPAKVRLALRLSNGDIMGVDD